MKKDLKAARFNGPALDHSNATVATPVEVAAGLVFREGKLLITRRPEEAHLGGLWEFPGGKRRPTESYSQCLIRELREELDIEIEVGPVLESITHAYPGKTVYLQFLVCRWLRREPRPLGCSAFRWITAAELKQYDFPAADAQLVAHLEGAPHLWGPWEPV